MPSLLTFFQNQVFLTESSKPHLINFLTSYFLIRQTNYQRISPILLWMLIWKKEVSMSFKKLFWGNIKFCEKYSLNSKKGGKPQILYNFDAIIFRINNNEAIYFTK